MRKLGSLVVDALSVPAAVLKLQYYDGTIDYSSARCHVHLLSMSRTYYQGQQKREHDFFVFFVCHLAIVTDLCSEVYFILSYVTVAPPHPPTRPPGIFPPSSQQTGDRREKWNAGVWELTIH